MVLSGDSVVSCSKNVLLPIRCEWNECTVVANSWSTLQQHQNNHCRRSRLKEGSYQCRLPRCLGSNHPSTLALQTHISMSHMTRIPLSCPVQGCMDDFIRRNYLEAHFQEAHPNISGPEMLKPLCLPKRPAALPPLPPIPCSSSHSYVLSAPFVSAARRRNTPVLSRPLGRKWSRLDAQDGEASEPIQIVFNNLRVFDKSPQCQPRDFAVRRKPQEFDSAVSRPPPMPTTPIPAKIPPVSILHESFVRRVENGESPFVVTS